jgi:hypothetical protein
VSAFEEAAPLGRSNIYELGVWPQDRGTCGVSGMARWHVVIHELEAGLPRAAPILRRRGPKGQAVSSRPMPRASSHTDHPI